MITAYVEENNKKLRNEDKSFRKHSETGTYKPIKNIKYRELANESFKNFVKSLIDQNNKHKSYNVDYCDICNLPKKLMTDELCDTYWR